MVQKIIFNTFNWGEGLGEMIRQSFDRCSAAGSACRHAVSMIAVDAGRLAAPAIASSLPSIFQSEDTSTLGVFLPGYHDGGPDENRFRRKTNELTPDGEVPVEDGPRWTRNANVEARAI
jgi:hypothetical protein